jgi:hypothetical protein
VRCWQAVLLQRIAHQLWITADPGNKMIALALQVRGSQPPTALV